MIFHHVRRETHEYIKLRDENDAVAQLDSSDGFFRFKRTTFFIQSSTCDNVGKLGLTMKRFKLRNVHQMFL